MNKKQNNILLKSSQATKTATMQYVPNRIRYYYKEIFNIEVLGFFTKKKDSIKNTYNNAEMFELDAKSNLEKFKFLILIKDNNKKIFKTKVLEAEMIKETQKNEISPNVFESKFYEIVDKRLATYCKKYLKDKTKKDKQKFNDIIIKNNQIDNEYQEWKQSQNK